MCARVCMYVLIFQILSVYTPTVRHPWTSRSPTMSPYLDLCVRVCVGVREGARERERERARESTCVSMCPSAARWFSWPTVSSISILQPAKTLLFLQPWESFLPLKTLIQPLWPLGTVPANAFPVQGNVCVDTVCDTCMACPARLLLDAAAAELAPVSHPRLTSGWEGTRQQSAFISSLAGRKRLGTPAACCFHRAHCFNVGDLEEQQQQQQWLWQHLRELLIACNLLLLLATFLHPDQ